MPAIDPNQSHLVQPKPISEKPGSETPDEKIAVPHVEGESKLIKKIVPILLIILIIIGISFAIFRFVLPRLSQKSGIGGKKEATLTYWGLWEPEAVMSEILTDWAQEHPEIKINYVFQSPKEYRERLQSVLARGEGPDIFRFHITWTPMFKNELEPVPSSVMSASQFENSFYPVAATTLRLGSNFLGVPLMMDTLALFYNESLFQAAGKSPPKTWEELRQLATDLTVKDENGRIVVAGAALGVTGNVDHWSDILGLMMLQNGADLSDPAACQRQGDEEICLGVDALSFFTIFSQTDRVWDETMPSSTTAFATEKLAMYFGPSWRVFNIKEVNPQLNFKIAPAPQLSGTEITWASFWAEGVNKSSQHKKEAWEFLKFLSSQETMEKLYQTASKTRLFGELYSRVEMAPLLNQNALAKPFLDQAPKAQTWYLCSRTHDNGLNDRMIKYFEDAVNAVNQGRSAKEALKTVSNGVSQLLSQYGIATSIVR